MERRINWDWSQGSEASSMILPMHEVSAAGYLVKWTGGVCSLQAPGGAEIAVEQGDGCPTVDAEVGQRILDKLEQRQQRGEARRMKLRRLEAGELQPEELDIPTALTMSCQAMFKDVPDYILQKVVPEDLDWQEAQQEQLPWNRRSRRRHHKAKRIIIHLYSGPDEKYWLEKLQGPETEVICIDTCLNPGYNMLNDRVMSYLIKLALQGKVVAVIGGPPCRTVSACRYNEQGTPEAETWQGPRPVRSEQHPFGLPTNTAQETELVTQDSILFLRQLFLYGLSEELRPEESAETMLALEQPEDPARYRQDADVKGYMSMFRTVFWKEFAEKHKVKMAHLDQGCMGHEKTKPTTVAYAGMDLTPLHGMRMEKKAQQVYRMARCKGHQQEDRIDKGMGSLGTGPQGSSVRSDHCAVEEARGFQHRIGLQALKTDAKEMWKSHVMNGHYPARRDCAVCVQAAGRSKSHRRLQHPDCYTLSVDLSGKLPPGKDQLNPVAKYIVVGVYTFPVTKQGQPLIEPWKEDTTPQDVPLPGVDWDGEEPVEAPLPAEDNEDLVEEDQEEMQMTAEQGRRAKATRDAWDRMIELSTDVTVQNLTLVEIVADRTVQQVLHALARMHARLRSLGLPVHRLHGDKAKELVSHQTHRWAADRQIVVTHTSGLGRFLQEQWTCGAGSWDAEEDGTDTPEESGLGGESATSLAGFPNWGNWGVQFLRCFQLDKEHWLWGRSGNIAMRLGGTPGRMWWSFQWTRIRHWIDNAGLCGTVNRHWVVVYDRRCGSGPSSDSGSESADWTGTASRKVESVEQWRA